MVLLGAFGHTWTPHLYDMLGSWQLCPFTPLEPGEGEPSLPNKL